MDHWEGSDNGQWILFPLRTIRNEEEGSLWKCIDKNRCYWPIGFMDMN